MIIYFRVCEKQATISHVSRYNDSSKVDIIKRCWLSLQESVNSDDRIIIIHDEVSDSTLKYLEDTSKTENIKFVEVQPHDWDYHEHTVTLVEVLEQEARLYPEELHFILEDDYLHVPNALNVLRATLSGWDHFAVPYDYIDRYINTEAATILLGPDRHWRTVNSSTMTVVAKGKTWLEYINDLRAAAPTSNDQVFLDIYKISSCISPLPGVSSHMTGKHDTPYIDWQGIWDKYSE